MPFFVELCFLFHLLKLLLHSHVDLSQLILTIVHLGVVLLVDLLVLVEILVVGLTSFVIEIHANALLLALLFLAFLLLLFRDASGPL